MSQWNWNMFNVT